MKGPKLEATRVDFVRSSHPQIFHLQDLKSSLSFGAFQGGNIKQVVVNDMSINFGDNVVCFGIIS